MDCLKQLELLDVEEAYFSEQIPLSGHKKIEYRVVMLVVLLYGAAWRTKAAHVRCLNSFQNCCTLGVMRYQQWKEKLKWVAPVFVMRQSIPETNWNLASDELHCPLLVNITVLMDEEMLIGAVRRFLTVKLLWFLGGL